MSDLLPGFLQFDEFGAANSILLFGLILLLGAAGGVIFKRLKIPQVVGYIVIGIIIGQSGSRWLSVPVISSLEPVSSFALGLIGFLIGSELKGQVIRKYGKQFTGILLLESIVPFIVVSTLVTLIGTLISGDLPRSAALGLVLGSISAATAPAATTDVLNENRAKGPLTTMVLGIVALDDAVALVLFTVAGTIASALLGSTPLPITSQLLAIAYKIGGSVVFGSLCGFLLSLIIKRVKNDDGRVLAFALGAIMLVTGISGFLHLDTILAAMAMGCFIVNFAPFSSRDLFALVDRFTPPIYVLFFVLVGARLNVRSITPLFAVFAAVYIIGRTGGKALGSHIGALVTGAPVSVRKYLKWCLLSQAGVAIGLSIAAGRLFPDSIGSTVVLVVTATTFVVQIAGPICVKHGISRAGECGLDITEDDLIRECTVQDVISSQRVLTHLLDDAPFKRLIDAFSKQSALSCLVCTADKKLAGIVTVENLKEALLLGDIADALLVCDVMTTAPVTCLPTDSVLDIREILRLKNLETIPVVDETGQVLGIMENQLIEKHIRRKVLELHERACALERA